MCTIHSQVLEENQRELLPGAVLVLREVNLYVCMYVCMCMYVYVCMYVCYVCIDVRYVCTYVL